MSFCKRVELPWGLPCSEVYLYCFCCPAGGEEMAVCAAHPILPSLPSQCPLTTSSGRELKEHFRYQEEGEKPV